MDGQIRTSLRVHCNVLRVMVNYFKLCNNSTKGKAETTINMLIFKVESIREEKLVNFVERKQQLFFSCSVTTAISLQAFT